MIMCNSGTYLVFAGNFRMYVKACGRRVSPYSICNAILSALNSGTGCVER
jgi:hypothetical protein